MLKVGVIGATGYTGEEIIKLLVRHKGVKVTVLQAVIDEEVPISKIFPYLKGKLDEVCRKPDWDKAMSVDLIFLALPHKVSMKVAPVFLKEGKRVIDLSADYRLEADVYERWYGSEHEDTASLEKAVYGLPEFFRSKVKKAKLIANPGCYPTSAVLPIVPLAKEGLVDVKKIVIDSKSGATGAGRKPSIALSFSELNENMKAYKIDEHQHKPEINRVISMFSKEKADVVFTPHIMSISRGILSTIYMDLTKKGKKKGYSAGDLINLYRKFYRNTSFAKIMDEGTLPALKDVQFTNACHIGIKVTSKKIVAVSCIDNLLKGAAGQAVQNMNIMYGFKETEGLD